MVAVNGSVMIRSFATPEFSPHNNSDSGIETLEIQIHQGQLDPHRE
jgi:hypothetical protein